MLQNSNNDLRNNMTPVEKLLFELNIKMCTVGGLCTLLKNCALFDALMILSQSENLFITRNPDFEYDTNMLEIALGQKLILNCKAIGLPVPKYVWYHGNIQLANCCSDHLEISINSVNQEGEYKCAVSQFDNDGLIIDQQFSKPMFVKVKSTPVAITKQPISFLEVKEGDDFMLSCEVQGHPPPQYQWFRDNTKLDKQTSNILQINKFSSADEGIYHCYAYNNIGEVYSQRCNVMMDLPRYKAVAKIALLIANEDYENHDKLHTPKNDVAKIARLLSEIGFKVICLLNLTFTQMKNAIKTFSEALSEGVYGLFYFAGHGFKMQESYMLAIDAPEAYLRKNAICESQLLSTVLQNDPTLLVVILDMCQTIPPKEYNPAIYEEVPTIKEYKGQQNLRNLIQAYSTSSYRPSYERMSDGCGLYVTHLSKYIDKNIPVTKVFEKVGKSIDTWLKGVERNQIPMFATTVTKPYRLTDSTYKRSPPPAVEALNKFMSFPTKSCTVKFCEGQLQCTITICPHIVPYLNIIRLIVSCPENYSANFYNSIPVKQNNLFENSRKKECVIFNPQISKGPLVISLTRNGSRVCASLFQIMDYVPTILQVLD
ncbi:mucosa-associated lymphoid tissue lymphoma translocation protein 1 isoform X2 [Orussus abietinus]|nr:mucosa-associated lymphoid tissue lymphoma translocation protein 1 isoform X2 [Orussus abietinus]